MPVIVWARLPERRIKEASAKLASLVVPLVLKDAPALRAADLVTSNFPPIAERPSVTVNVFPVATVVLPLSDTLPVPVLNAPPPFCVKFLPVAIVVSPFSETRPDPVENAFAPETVVLPLKVMPPVAPELIVTGLFDVNRRINAC
jgi:hypothetical protein